MLREKSGPATPHFRLVRIVLLGRRVVPAAIRLRTPPFVALPRRARVVLPAVLRLNLRRRAPRLVVTRGATPVVILLLALWPIVVRRPAVTPIVLCLAWLVVARRAAPAPIVGRLAPRLIIRGRVTAAAIVGLRRRAVVAPVGTATAPVGPVVGIRAIPVPIPSAGAVGLGLKPPQPTVIRIATTGLRHRDRAAGADVDATHASAGIVVDGPLALARVRHETVVPETVAILEDEPRFGAVGPGKDDARAPVIAVGVVVGVVEYHDPEADAGIRIRIPRRVTGIAVTV